MADFPRAGGLRLSTSEISLAWSFSHV